LTRIASYGLYQCSDCLQVHIKPNYGSISINVPLDAFVSNSEVVTCKSCGIKKEIDKFVYLGMRSKQNSYKPNIFERIAIKFGWKLQPEELDVRKLYPKLLD
jgi:hypothetical protein